jgi:Tfp pilus assembly protein PilF
VLSPALLITIAALGTLVLVSGGFWWWNSRSSSPEFAHYQNGNRAEKAEPATAIPKANDAMRRNASPLVLPAVETPAHKPAALPAGYVGMKACADCHADIAETYSKVAMGRSAYSPAAGPLIEDFTTNSEFYHAASHQYFRMSRENGKVYQERYQKGANGKIINSMKLEAQLVIGSGNHARSYIHRSADGKMYQLPVAWYTQEEKWAMNPGYDNAGNPGFTRRITYDCAYCHGAIPAIEPGLDRYNYAETSVFPADFHAIDCERCHGPGAKHVELANRNADDAQLKASIINPASLSPKLQMDVCMQCHLETTSSKLPHAVHRVDRSVYDFRPGEDLNQQIITFNHPPGTGHDDKFEIAGQAYRLRMSKCFTASEGKLTCITCHDPHRVPEDRLSFQLQNCMKCHQKASCTAPPEARLAVADNCIQCHMPSRRTDDAVHVVMTDHYIQRFKPARDLTAAKPEIVADYKGDLALYYPAALPPDEFNLYMGIAYIADEANVAKGADYLTRYLASHPDHFDARFARGVAYKLENKLDEAEADLESAARQKPQHPELLMALADVYERQARHAEAAELFERAAKIRPDIARSRNGLGSNRYYQGDVAGALKAYHDAAAADSLDKDSRFNLGSIANAQGKYADAERELQAGLAIAPADADGLHSMAETKAHLGKWLDAAWIGSEASRVAPFRGEMFDALGELLKSSPVELRKEMISVISSNTPFEGAVLLASLTAQQENPGAAVALLDKHLASETSNVLALVTAGQLCASADETTRSAAFFGAARQLAPDFDDAVIGYASAINRNGESVAALGVLKDAITSQPENAKLLNATGWLLATTSDDRIRNGNEAEALARKSAQILGQPNIFTLDTIAAAKAEQGQFEMAAKTAEQAAEMAEKANLKEQAKQIAARADLYAHQKKYRQ